MRSRQFYGAASLLLSVPVPALSLDMRMGGGRKGKLQSDLTRSAKTKPQLAAEEDHIYQLSSARFFIASGKFSGYPFQLASKNSLTAISLPFNDEPNKQRKRFTETTLDADYSLKNINIFTKEKQAKKIGRKSMQKDNNNLADVISSRP